MKSKKRLISLVLVVLMIISNLIFPFQQIVYAVGEKSITFSGHNLVVNPDGSITFDCEVEDNSGRITIAVYNAENQLIEAISEGNGFDARVELNSTSYEGFYCRVSSDVVEVNNIKFDIAGHICHVGQNGRFDLPNNVEHISVDYYNIRPLHEIKEVSFYSENISVNQDGSVNLYCDLEYNSGTIKTYLFNSDDSQVNIEKCIYWSSESQSNYESDTNATGKLNTTTYQGSYLMMYSEEVNLRDVKIDIEGQDYLIGENGRVDLPDVERIDISQYRLREVIQKKEIFFESNQIQINNNSGEVALEVKIQNRVGIIYVTPYNSDNSVINVYKYDSEWNEETQEWQECVGKGWGKVNGTTFEGVYLMIRSDDFNLSNYQFDFGMGPFTIDQSGRVDLSQYQWVSLFDNKEINFRSNSLVINNGTVTMNTEIEENEGKITFEIFNADGSKVNIRNPKYWNEELQENQPDPRTGVGKFNTIVYNGAYMIVTADNGVDLSDIVLDICNNRIEIGNGGRVDFPSNTDYDIYIGPENIREKIEKKVIEFESDSLIFNGDGTVSMNTEIEGNEGLITLELRNSDNSKVNIRQLTQWNNELQQDEPDPRRGEGKLNSTTYEGAYLIVTAEQGVDLTNIVFELAGNRIEIDSETGRVDLPKNAQYLWIESHSICEKNPKVEAYFYFDNLTVNNNGTISVPCTIKNNRGTLNIALFNSDNSQVMIHKSIYYDWENDEYYESDTDATAKLNTSSYEGAYFLVTTPDGVDLTNVKFNIGDKEVLIDSNGKAVFNGLDYVYLDKHSIKSVNPIMIPVTVNATITGANFEKLCINGVDFIDEDIVTNTVNVTRNIEDCDEDYFEIGIENGKIINTVRINERQEDDLGYMWLDFDYPHADTYTIEITCEDDPYYLPSIFWCYEDSVVGDEDALIKNGTVEIVSVALPDGETVYNLDELLPEDTPGMGRHPKHEEAYLRDEIEYGYGELYAQIGSTVTLKLIPDEGYEVSSLDLGRGLQLIPDPDVPNQYSFVMPNRTIYLSGLITKIKTYFDVTELGAIPNDGLDDRDAINSALRKAKDTNDIITVYIPAGEYIISNPLHIYSNTKLILDEKAIIKSTTSVDNMAMIIGMADDDTDTHGGYTRLQNIEISGGTWDRNSSSNIISMVMALQHGNNINIHDLTVKNCTDHMINVSADKDVTIKNVVFQNHIAYTGTSNEYWDDNEVGNTDRHMATEAIHTDFAGDGEKGIYQDNTSCENITVDGCKFVGVLAGIGNHHETQYKAKNIIVKNCEFTDIQYGAAVNAWSFENLTFTDNTITGYNYGVISKDSTVSILNNHFTFKGTVSQDELKYAVLIEKGKANISNNVITGAQRTAIKASDTTEISILNNTLSNMKFYGIDIENCNGRNNITLNTISIDSSSDTETVGMYLKKLSSSTIIENNNISGAFKHEMLIDETDAIIKTNTLNSKANAIMTLNSKVQIISNQITNTGDNNQKYGIVVTGGEVIASGNTIKGSHKTGIKVNDTTKMSITENKILDMSNFGIDLENCNGVNIIATNTINTPTSTNAVAIYSESLSSNTTIENNVISGQFRHDILLYKSDALVKGNKLNSSISPAINTNESKAQIISNEITNTTENAIFCEKGELTITGNKINNAGISGIRAKDVSKISVNNNIINNVNDYGIFINNSNSGVTISSNEIYGQNEKIGIVINTCKGSNLIEKNIVRCGTTAGIYAINSSGTISENDVQQCSGDALHTLGENSDNIVTFVIKDNILKTASTSNFDIRLNSFSRNCSLSNNILGNRGLYVAGGVTYTTSEFTGLREVDKIWYYYKNGEVDTTFTGLVEHNGKMFYVKNGQIDWSYKGLIYFNNIWYYIADGQIDYNYKGLVSYNNAWFYVKNGQIDWSYTGLEKYNNSWYYVKNGKLDWSYTGICEYDGKNYYIQKGTINWGANGLAQVGGTWYYFEKGSIKTDYTDLVQYNGAWFYVKNGKLDWSYTGLAKHNNTWYYVKNGKLDWSYTGICEYNGKNYYILKGTINWGANGLAQVSGVWYYFSNGSIQTNYTNLVQYNGSWFYVKSGKLDWSYTGLAQYNGSWFYIKSGKLDWSYSGLAQYNGSWFYVKSGKLDWSYTGLEQYNNTWYYIKNGKLDWGYTGLAQHNGSLFYIKGGKIDWSYNGTVTQDGKTYTVKNGKVVN